MQEMRKENERFNRVNLFLDDVVVRRSRRALFAKSIA